jgi:hypothetical protein
MTKRIFVVVAVLLVLFGLLGCSRKVEYGMNVDAVVLAGPGTLGLSVGGQQVKALVVSPRE